MRDLRSRFATSATIFVLALALLTLLPSPRAADARSSAAELSTSVLFECQSDTVLRIYLRWAPSNEGLQWIDLSLFNNDFAIGTFMTSGPLPSQQDSLVWDGLLSGALHYARVNTLTADGWIESPMLVFFTPDDCAHAAHISASQPPLPIDCLDGQFQLTGCVSTGRADFATYEVGEAVFYCFAVSQATNVGLVTTKPDGSQVLVFNGYSEGPGACIGPYQANAPLGLRTVRLFLGPDLQLMSETHFIVR